MVTYDYKTLNVNDFVSLFTVSIKFLNYLIYSQEECFFNAIVSHVTAVKGKTPSYNNLDQVSVNALVIDSVLEMLH